MIHGDGEQTRDFIYVADIIRTIDPAAIDKIIGIFNATGGRSMSLNHLMGLIAKVARLEVEPRHAGPGPGDIKRSLADISEVQRIGYAPRRSFEHGLLETMYWFEQRHFLETKGDSA